MPGLPIDVSLPPRRPSWKWWICGLLLLATMLNYMDRLTLNLTSKQIKDDFGLNNRDYAQLESAFAFAFALGAIVFGWLADRWPVRWLYPAAVLAWSFAGFSTGLAGTFGHLLICRALLGLCEAGNWPCALRTTQHILPPSERTMGNSLLQSGAALGAVLTPIIVIGLGTLTGSWRPAFLAIGVLGATWAFIWLPSVRRGDLEIASNRGGPTLVSILGWLVVLLAIDTIVHMGASPDATPWLHSINESAISFLQIEPRWLPVVTRIVVTLLGIGGVFLWLRTATREDRYLPRRSFFLRFWAMVALVISINITWHFLRAWLPLFLQEAHGYTQVQAGWFVLAYYVAADAGSLTSGVIVLSLARMGMAVFWSRVAVFTVCALLMLLGLIVAVMPAGALMLLALLVIGFSSLAVFPIYYSFSQDLTVRHQGKVTGALGCINWLAMFLLHELVGESIERTKSYADALSFTALAPLVGFAVMLLLWRQAPPAPVEPIPPLDQAPAVPDERIQSAAAREQFTSGNG